MKNVWKIIRMIYSNRKKKNNRLEQNKTEWYSEDINSLADTKEQKLFHAACEE